MAAQPQVTIYSTPTCHFCREAKNFFDDNKVAYTDYNVASDMVKRKEMIQKSGQMGVPVIYIGDKLVVGYDQDQLKQLLNL
ncbi:MAG: glutaredoxin-like protein [Parcubacteria group bacterium Gr01-1014_8]|nr:MAG: glutaredoxin-like protein [Parcubacteria group bacterium Gr01-1014_8]